MENNMQVHDLDRGSLRPCSGPGCKTLVAGDDPFCSQWCRDVAMDVLPERFPCRCGHTCCGGENSAPHGCVSDAA